MKHTANAVPAINGRAHGPIWPLSLNNEIGAMTTSATSGTPSVCGSGRQSARTKLTNATFRLVSDGTSLSFPPGKRKARNMTMVITSTLPHCRSSVSSFILTWHSEGEA